MSANPKPKLLPPADSAKRRPPEERNAAQFFLEHGRLPKIGDPISPWKFKGWCLFYVQGAHMEAGLCSNRWGYYVRTLKAGHLLPDPIPELQFGHAGHSVDEGSDGHKAVNRWIDIVWDHIGSISAFPALLDWLSYGLGLSKEYPRLPEAVQERLYREVNLEPILRHPYDYLGGLYQQTKGNRRWNSTGFYVTPHNVCELMARMVMHDMTQGPSKGGQRDPRTASVCDPCVGSGRMLLHAANQSLSLWGMDIDPVCCAMARINGALYVPWMAFPFSQSLLDAPRPAPPPALLPVAKEHQPQPGQMAYRIDDPQLSLFY